MGGVFLVRHSFGSTPREFRLYRLNSTLSTHPGWSDGGILLTTTSFSDVVLTADGQGGAFLAFVTRDAGKPQGLIAQHLAGDGAPAPGWTGDGYVLSPVGFQQKIVRSGAGAIVAWEEHEWDRPGGAGIYVQHLVPDGPVAVEVSLVSADVVPGEASLRWHMSGAAALSATVERRSEESDWSALSTVSADGQGNVRYVDRSVGTGRYAYRLSWFEDGATRQSGETWVDVPEAWKLALAARNANPGSGPAVFSVTLPSRSPGAIELLDLQGRRVAHRDLGTYEAGVHSVTIEEAATLAPGIYLARLSHGKASRTVRITRIR